MPYLEFSEAMYKPVADMLREMADILERRPEDVVSMEHLVTTDYIALGGKPLAKTYTVTINTRKVSDAGTTSHQVQGDETGREGRVPPGEEG